MALQRVVSWELSGPLDQPTLESLRASLALDKRGRLTDDQDRIFGKRVTTAEDGRIQVRLSRDDVREGWNVDLLTDGDLSPAALAPWEAQVAAAVATTGLTVQRILRPTA